MKKVNNLIAERAKVKKNSSKMSKLAKLSSEGNRTSFSGIFNIIELNTNEKRHLENILHQFSKKPETLPKDLEELVSITSEVKAINAQAAILHGERIKKAQNVLKNYREGAFSAWLIAIYGNRQTPYNLLQYYEFYQSMPNHLHPQIQAMPKQAVYTLASREGAKEKKETIVENYNGETKTQLLQMIRNAFPLKKGDLRKENASESIISNLKSLVAKSQRACCSPQQKEVISVLLKTLKKILI